MSALTPGQHFRQSSSPREPNARQSPPSGQIKAAALRGFPLLRRSHDQPSRRTLLLRALGQCSRGDGLMYENAAVLGCVAASLFSPWYFLQRPLWANGGSGSIPKMLRRPKPPLRGDPQARQRPGRPGPRSQRPAPANSPALPPRIFPRCITQGPSNTFY